MNILLTIEYDGSSFAGWQRQAYGYGYSVQQAVEEALSNVLKEPVKINGAGRTDAGVHALGQCCTFNCTKPVPVSRLPQIINNRLPRSIRVIAAEEKSDKFHARISARGKHYRYVIERNAAVSAFCGRYSWQIDRELDIPSMRIGADYLLGEHDFRNYTLTAASATNFVRRIDQLKISEPKTGEIFFPWQDMSHPVVIDAIGNGFLYKMVRLIVGRLVAVGSGDISPQAIQSFLDGSFSKNIPPAPASGLMLMQVYY